MCPKYSGEKVLKFSKKTREIWILIHTYDNNIHIMYNMANTYMKMSYIIKVLQLKQEWDTSTDCLEWPKYRALPQTLVRTRSPRNSLPHWWECNIVQPLENSLVEILSYHTVLIIYSRGVENLRLHKCLQTNIYGSFVNNC